MRTLLIFFSMGVLLTWIHCSHGARKRIELNISAQWIYCLLFVARRARFLASDELQTIMKEFSNDIDENSSSESDEEINEKKIVDGNDSASQSSEELDLEQDNEVILPPLIDIRPQQTPEDNEDE